MHWLEESHVDDYGVEVLSLPCSFQDRERIGRILSISHDCVIIQLDNGPRIKWLDDKLVRIPDSIIS
jgi:hypothetical protein